MNSAIDHETWNATTPAGKANLLRVIRHEADGFLALVEATGSWEGPTAAGHWEVRDVAAHLVDVTGLFIDCIGHARGGTEPEPIGTIRELDKFMDQHALAFRSVPQGELTSRLRRQSEHLFAVIEELTGEEWTGLAVRQDPYLGTPLPVFMYPVFALSDYALHAWDIREGQRLAHALSADTADLLVPFMPGLWQMTTDPTRVGDTPIEVGVRVTGRNAAAWRVSVTAGGLTYDPGSVEDLPAIIDFDPAALVLTAFGRIRGGNVHGDPTLASRFLGFFFAI